MFGEQAVFNRKWDTGCETMGIDLALYRGRIGLFNSRKHITKEKKDSSSEIRIWFLFLILAGLLIIGGIEANPGPTMTDLEEKMNKIVDMLANHSLEINKKVDNLNKDWTGITKDVITIKKDMVKVKEQIQVTGTLERNYWNHNLIIFGLKEFQYESKWDTECRVLDLFKINST